MNTCKGCGRPLEPEKPKDPADDFEERLFYKAFNPDAIVEAQEVLYEIQRANQPPGTFAEREGLCDQCVVECNRLTEIGALITKPLTGREEVEIALEHESLVLNMTDEEIEAHILDLKRKIETFRVRLIKTKEIKSKRDTEKFSGFTPEEIARLKAEQAMKRVAKKQEEKRPRMDKREAAIESMVKLGIPREAAEKLISSAGGAG